MPIMHLVPVPSRFQTNTQGGFTLVELIVVVAITGILMAIAVPDFIKSTRGIELAHQAKEMESAIKFARAKAMQLGQEVAMCRSDATQTKCNTGSPSDEWQNGWLIFSDLNSNGAYDQPTTSPVTMADEQLFQIKQAMSSGFTVVANNNQIGNYIAFNPAGEASGNLGNVGKFTFRHTSFTNSSNNLYLLINRTGRVRILNAAQCAADSGC
jgi:type IV fimbrial biogenesis protein FimT